MPRKPKFGHLPTLTAEEKVIAVTESATFADMRHALSATDPWGANGTYPPLLLLLVLVANRIYTSQNKALAAVRRHWPNIIATYRECLALDDVYLPHKAPTAAHMDRFVAHIAAHPHLLDEIRRHLTCIGIGQARRFGHFAHGVAPDFAHPDHRHVLIGDGTYYSPFSKVRRVVDKVTGEITVRGSRSEDEDPLTKARIQQWPTGDDIDFEKDATAINHVTVSTWTDAGLVVLGVDQATAHGEAVIAKQLINEVCDVIGEGVHTVVWDGALKDGAIANLMAHRGILVVNKGPRRGKQKVPYYTPLKIKAAKAIEMAEDTPPTPLPVGTSVYSKAGKWEVVRGKYARFGVLNEGGCSHELWVDDGALFDVDHFRNHCWKQQRVDAEVSRATRGKDGTFELHTRWSLPCALAGRGRHQFHTTWAASQRPGKVDTGSQEYAISLLRPVPRADVARFRPLYGLRNITESFHSWAKRHFGSGRNAGRAQHLNPKAQLLDHIAVSLLNNCMADWRGEQLGI